MSVIPIGTEVNIIDAGVKGRIVSISIRGINHQYVRYEVSWWNGNSHMDNWFEECQLSFTEQQKERIGFRETPRA